MISNSINYNYNSVNKNKLNNSIEKYDYELFKGVFHNDVKKVREMIDCGCDINMREYENFRTPIHIAAARGHKQVLELLVSRGCDINVQDNRGVTPLHSLVTSRYDILALWLIRQGATFIKDNNGFTPLDLAQGWFKKEMTDVSEGRISNSEATLKEIESENNQKHQEYQSHLKSILKHHHEESKNSPNQYFISQNAQGQKILQTQQANFESPIKGVEGSGSEVLKIYFRNDSYKSIKVSSTDDAQSIIRVMCEKINMKSFDKCFDLIETIKGQNRFLNPQELLLDAKSKWPIIISSEQGIATNNFCHFSLVIKKTAPKDAITNFQNIL